MGENVTTSRRENFIRSKLCTKLSHDPNGSIPLAPTILQENSSCTTNLSSSIEIFYVTNNDRYIHKKLGV